MSFNNIIPAWLLTPMTDHDGDTIVIGKKYICLRGIVGIVTSIKADNGSWLAVGKTANGSKWQSKYPEKAEGEDYNDTSTDD